MTILAQHGHGKGDMIDLGLKDQSLSGVILGPTNEAPDRLRDYIVSLKKTYPNAAVAVDPQVYVATLPEPKLRYLSEYPYFPGGRTLSPERLTPRKTIKLVNEAMDWQINLSVDRLFSPTIPVETFAVDASTKAAYDLAQESCAWYHDQTDDRPLYLSVVVRQHAFHSQQAVKEFVDFITGLEPSPAGIYLIVERGESRYTQNIDETVLENLLWMVHALSRVHLLKVVVGYTDFIGVLLHAVGAEATATGWYHSLRQFSMMRFIPRDGGAPANPRYTSGPLLDSLLLTDVPALNDMKISASKTGLDLASSNSGQDLDLILNPGSIVWPASLSVRHHWATIADLTKHVMNQKPGRDQLEAVQKLVNEAAERWRTLKAAGFAHGVPSAGAHVGSWQTAIRRFRAEVQM